MFTSTPNQTLLRRRSIVGQIGGLTLNCTAPTTDCAALSVNGGTNERTINGTNPLIAHAHNDQGLAV